MKLKCVTYEESRLEYFQEQHAAAKRKLNYWIDAMRSGRHGYSQVEYEDKCAECGVRISFYADVIKMLGGEVDDENT